MNDAILKHKQQQKTGLIQHIALASMCLSIFTTTFNTTGLVNALLTIQTEFTLSTMQLQWLVNAYMLSTAGFIIIGGQFSDLLGRKKIFLIGTCLFIIASIIIGMTHSFVILIAGRILQGMGAALLIPSSLAISKSLFSKEWQMQAIGIWMACVGLGFAMGPVCSGILLTFLNWRYLFLLNTPLMLTAALLCMYTLPNTIQSNTSKAIDLKGFILFLLGIWPLMLGLMQGNIWHWLNIKTLLSIGCGTLLLSGFYFYEKKTASPLIHFRHFKNSSFVACSLGSMLTFLCLHSILYFFNLYIQNPLLLHFTPIHAAYAILPVTLGFFLSSLIAPYLCKIEYIKYALIISLLIIAIGFSTLALIPFTKGYASICPILAILGMGLGFAMTGFSNLGLGTLAKEYMGEASGIINTLNYLAAVLAIAVGTIIYTQVGTLSCKQMISSHPNVRNHLEQVLPLIPDYHQVAEQIDNTSQIMPLLQDCASKSFTYVMLYTAGIACLGAFFVGRMMTQANASAKGVSLSTPPK